MLLSAAYLGSKTLSPGFKVHFPAGVNDEAPGPALQLRYLNVSESYLLCGVGLGLYLLNKLEAFLCQGVVVGD